MKSNLLKIIAVDVTPILPGGENGGAKVFLLELLLQLSKLFPKTHFFLLTHVRSHDELAILDSNNMHRLNVIGLNGPIDIKKIKYELRKTSPLSLTIQAYHWIHKIRKGGINQLFFKKNKGSSSLLNLINADLLFCPFTAMPYYESGIPAVSTVYDLQHKTYPQFFSPAEVSHRDRIFEDACLKASGIAAISNYSRESSIKYGAEPSRIRTIYLRMSQRIALVNKVNSEILDKLKLNPNGYLIYPANFWKHKNHEMLLVAFGIACKQGLPEETKLVFTGSPGSRQDFLIKAVRVMHLEDRVLFPGYIPNESLAALLAHSSGMIFPSLYEGFGLPVVEAMAAGIPVACSNLTSLPEIAGEAALTFDPRVPTEMAEAILSLASDKTRFSHYIENGWNQAVIYSDVELMAREYWNLFLDALINEKRNSLISGVYFDEGWVGKGFNVVVAPAVYKQELRLEILAPEFLPFDFVELKISSLDKTQELTFNCERGSSKKFVIPFRAAGGSCQINISPTFIPNKIFNNGDLRNLSIILKSCKIHVENNEIVDLFRKDTK